jgi:1-acyl-sn-glycerol-3-phosphate acyltransferase
MLPSYQSLVKNLDFDDAGHGYDEFGMHPKTLARGVRSLAFFYDHYFRVQSHHPEHIPAQGGAVFAGNHSGMLPFDGIMLAMDVLAHTMPHRVPRPAGDLFVPLLPFVGTFFARCGLVSGSRGNVRRLLETGQMVMTFPEGVAGISKNFSQRYQLQQWSVGHCELAIRYQVPVVPVGIVGAEESWPQVGKIKSIRLFGSPFLPIPATPLPLPSRFHILYGKPLNVFEGHPPEASDDPAVVGAAALKVKSAVQALLEEGLRERQGVFQ